MTSEEKKEIRVSAISLALMLGVIGGLLFWKDKTGAARILWSVSGACLLLGLPYPPLFWPVHKVWSAVTRAIAWFNTRLILTIVFYLAFVPVGLFMRLIGRDPLEKNWKKARPAWKERPQKPYDPRSMHRRF